MTTCSLRLTLVVAAAVTLGFWSGFACLSNDVSAKGSPDRSSFSLVAKPSPTPTVGPPNPFDETEETINQRKKPIEVGRPKVYDDTVLRQMLQNAEAKLAAMQVLDQSGLVQRLGAVSGVTQQISSLGINLATPAIPGQTVTANGPTGSTKTTVNSGGTTTETNSGLPVTNVSTTVPQFSPPPVTAPGPSTTMPSNIAPSSSAILNEMMQLTYEIASLRLALEGSLSDQLDLNGQLKTRLTVGVPITLSPDDKDLYKDAVAVVEVEVETTGEGTEPPAITAVLPREKTYNVAAITDKSRSLGGGVVTQIVGGSFSWLHGRKTYYLAQDTDTLALNFTPRTSTHVGFMWQFRPVLGEAFVRAGLRQTFVQIAFAKRPGPEMGKIHVRTYWRRFDRKRGILSEVVPGTVRNNDVVAPLSAYPLVLSTAANFNQSNLEDLGGGQMLVDYQAGYLPGTSIRIGNNIIGSWSSSADFQPGAIRFVASIADLATKKVFLVGRDGAEMPLLMERSGCQMALDVGADDLKIKSVDASTSLLTIEIRPQCYLEDKPPTDGSHPVNPPLLLVIGNRVFGYSDAPLLREANSVSVVVPTTLLLNNSSITLKSLFQKDQYKATVSLSGLFTGSGAAASQGNQYLLSQTPRLVFIGQNERTSRYAFLIYGNQLEGLKVIDPAVNIDPVAPGEPVATLGRIELTGAQLNTQKSILLKRENERAFTVAIPALDAKSGGPDIKPSERIAVGAEDALILGDVKDLTRVAYNGTGIPMEKAADGKSVRLKGLAANGVTTTATTKTLVFWFGEKSVEVKLEVVTAKVETMAK